MSKISAFEWLFIAALAIIAIGLICKLPDADAPVDHDFGEYQSEQDIPAMLPKSTAPIVQTGYIEESTEAEEPDVYPDDNEDELIVAALYASGYFREDVPLDYVLQDHLRTACEAYHVPFELALGVIEVESNFDPDVVSSSGARGLMQLMPMYFGSSLTPAENINAGVQFLGELYDKYGNWTDALIVYHSGHLVASTFYADKVKAAAMDWGWRP